MKAHKFKYEEKNTNGTKRGNVCNCWLPSRDCQREFDKGVFMV